MSARALDLSPAVDALSREVALGLAQRDQKTIPSQYLYDELGSILFEAITVLPEYGLTRADARLLRLHAPEMLAALPHRELTIAELGSGSGTKTRWLLEAAVRRSVSQPVIYQPIDISESAVRQCVQSLDMMPGVAVEPHIATYLTGLKEVTSRRPRHQGLLVLFLGSTIGNFDVTEARTFLTGIRALLEPGDALLLGTDLVKPLPVMLAAYDDPTGVTAAFNLNLLGRLNRELDAGFDLLQFRHEARFNQAHSRIEMHLRSVTAQKIPIRALGRSFDFRAGETIWTEGSHKFRIADVDALARETGFSVRAQWIDRDWPFAETLILAQ